MLPIIKYHQWNVFMLQFLFTLRLTMMKTACCPFNASSPTLFFVMAPTIRGQTIPDRVPTPLEIPIRMLA